MLIQRGDVLPAGGNVGVDRVIAIVVGMVFDGEQERMVRARLRQRTGEAALSRGVVQQPQLAVGLHALADHVDELCLLHVVSAKVGDAGRLQTLDGMARHRNVVRVGEEGPQPVVLRVVDEQMNDVPRDGATVGEIVVRGNVVMKGYYNDPDATALALRGGYFHSGDAAVVHPDCYVDIRDRLKDVIISGGENISSVEVEGTLLRHPAVQEIAVVGMPDAKWGEAPHAFLIAKPGVNVTSEELRAFVRERLAHFKCPQTFNFVTDLPKSFAGVAARFLGGSAEHVTQIDL